MRKVLLAALLAFSTPVAAGAAQAASEAVAPAAITVTEKVMVPMRDGVRISVDIYRPAGAVDGKYPVILQRWSYGRKAQDTAEVGRYFAAHGYVFVSSDMRGNNDAEGVYYMHDPVNDPRDGHDLVEWLAAQSWSTGAVGTFGVSYGGHTQYNTALGHPPHLKAQFLVNPVTDYHDGGGAWSQGAWMGDHNFSHTLRAIEAMTTTKNDPGLRKYVAEIQKNYDYWLSQPASKQLELLAPSPPAAKWFGDWLNHPDADAYWAAYGINSSRFAEYPDIPIFFWGSWYDHMQRPFLKTYMGLRDAGSAPKQLFSGPWNHGGAGRTHGDVDFGEAAAIDRLAVATAWFDHWLKDLPAPAKAPVQIFVMGSGDGHKTADGKLFHGGFWRDEQQYPLVRTQYVKYFLQQDGRLATDTPKTAKPAELIADPAHPVPTIFGRTGAAYDQRCNIKYKGCENDKPLSSRSDVLVFRTAPLEQDVEVTGPISVTLYFRSDARDTDLAVKLVDEYPASKDFPQGFDLILTDALRRARYRDSLEHASLLEPNKDYAITIEVPPTSNIFKKGHRVRLDVSGSNFPKFDVNPGTGEAIQFHTGFKVQHNLIFRDAKRPSSITLPIIAASAVAPSSR